MAFEELLDRAGGMGLFQVLQICTLILPTISFPFHILLENFSAAVPDHRCWTNMLDNSSEVFTNLTHEALLAISIPAGPNLKPHQCRRFRHPQWQFLDPNATAANRSEAVTEPCVDGWVYDNSTFSSTIVTKWDLVCNSQSLKPLGQAIYMAGLMAGSVFWGFLSHRLGRKPMLSWCFLQVAMGSAGAILAPNFFIYCGLRFLSAFGMAGAFLAQFALTVEWTTVHRRDVAMTILCSISSMGHIVLAGLAFALRDWRNLQLAVSIPFLAAFLLSWWLPESARWLIIIGQPEKALRELQKVARINGHKEAKKTLTIEVLTSSMAKEATKTQQSVLDLFRQPVLCQRTCAMIVVNFSLMLSYYGLVLDLQSLGGNIFLLQTLFGVMDFLSRATTILLLRFLGRRMTLVGFQVLVGVCISANALVPQDLQTLRVALAILGKSCFGVCLTSLLLYIAELFPTVVRVTANGFLNSVGRLGSIIGPLIKMASQVLPLLPPLTYGALPIVSSLVFLLFLPETQGIQLPDTIQDLEGRSSTTKSSQQEVVIMESTWF
ncbi:solute carrier family 22 member 11 [Cricetulus griseus]|uniref:Solute carrier family 22 member 11 n=1 Tax=Cricetulus griseus TaxID=10029 RepID=A0A9J7GTL1_CRIGR|nr:solute carrier family 22 member 11 [Cricetulus griseus]ERE77742.1 solute carrier family 22 member 11-like protein [Cricetulus griseus]